MERLSSSIDGIASRYDVIVVGSGYGGAIAASRLARAGLRVCVLERGRERQPGEYPDTTLEGVEEMQFDLPGGHVGPRSAMFDFRVNQDITAVVGAGLGGTSIINAGVAIRPDARVFADERWPEALRREGGRRLEQGFELAEQMLGSTPLPDEIPLPPKLAALKRSAEHMGQPFLKPPLNITFVPGESFAGVPQPGCTLCGDCASGCNVGAKNTLLMNYLPDARRHGASFFVQAAVRRVERGADGAWRVHYQALHTGREAFDAPLLFVTATSSSSRRARSARPRSSCARTGRAASASPTGSARGSAATATCSPSATTPSRRSGAWASATARPRATRACPPSRPSAPASRASSTCAAPPTGAPA